ncbi:Uncharacterized protein PECH_007948 [Penicillium ucsense]|uniref:H/ACA ribonucleoprotein complex non-core subunit NAF1 n=1 Tax=Penicillium ucsense TaxID=2839758 RepID=A0A8J8W5V0_9EURO|nr:Uncharacterized protein PECM_004155 [Penicillium ucsense]KAF7734497.1 Uncharacterized protein PECH_007948 [Penicillium ucsense]
MSESRDLQIEAVGEIDRPPTSGPSTVHSSLGAGTPTESDSRNAPTGTDDEVIASNSTQEQTATGSDPISQTGSAIPGLGFINSSAQQQTTSGPSQLTETQPQTLPAQPELQTPSQELAQESSNASVGSNEQQAANGADTMEVDNHTTPIGETNIVRAEEMPQDNEMDEGEDDHPEWEVDSDPYESSSESSTSSDSSDSDDEDYPILSPEEQARILMLAEGGLDDEGNDKGKAGGKIRSTNEVDEDVLPIPELEITPDMKIVLLGKVQTAIENAVLIEASTSGEYQVLESGSLLCSEDRKILGVVSETLGRVENPLYTVMYKTAEEAQEKGMVKGLPIYYVEAHSTFVFTQPLKGLKGSDASNFHDEEVAEDEIEFSDDEAEAEYKRKLKQKRQERKGAGEGGAARGKKGPPGPSKLSHNELNYDDDGAAEEGYTPLARPTNLHEMMGAREAPVEGTERAGPSFRGGRGRGRGSERGGRGGRGRGGAGRGASWERDQDHRSHQQQNGSTSQYGHPSSAPQSQHSAPYGQPGFSQQQAYGMPQPFAGYPQYPQQQQQLPQFGQGQSPSPFPFQFPFQQPFAQASPFPAFPPGAHINPLFLAALQQQQQQQQYQQPQQAQQASQAPGQAQPPNPAAMNFDQVKAQLDLLRQLSNSNQGPPPS